nr:hypothetical protein CFP56_71931 [Quercus suber]
MFANALGSGCVVALFKIVTVGRNHIETLMRSFDLVNTCALSIACLSMHRTCWRFPWNKLACCLRWSCKDVEHFSQLLIMRRLDGLNRQRPHVSSFAANYTRLCRLSRSFRLSLVCLFVTSHCRDFDDIPVTGPICLTDLVFVQVLSRSTLVVLLSQLWGLFFSSFLLCEDLLRRVERLLRLWVEAQSLCLFLLLAFAAVQMDSLR